MSYLILGPLEVRDGDADVELPGGQQRKLLAILLLHAGKAVSSDRLIDELWAGKPPETAAKALQVYVSSLRKHLGSDAVDTVGAGYRLSAASQDTDAGQFEELLTEARTLEPAPAALKLRDALALWRGPAFADFAYDEFARSEIDRLEELRLGGIERRIDLELALGHHNDLVPELEALVRAHPQRERLRSQLMLALYRSGRQTEALDAYRDARNALHDDLGLEPSKELQTLQRAILTHDQSLAAPPPVDLPGPAEAGSRPESRGIRRPLLAVALGLAILGAAAGAIVLTLSDRVVKPIVVPPNSVARIDPAGTKVESVGVGRDPRAIAVGLGSVWVANAGNGTVDRLDPATGALRGQPIGIGGYDLSAIAVGFGSVWVADGNAGTITKIDPSLNQTEGSPIRLGRPTVAPAPVFFIAVDSRYVWATYGSQLLRIDPHTSQIKRVSIATPTGLATGGDTIWVASFNHLYSYSPKTMKKVNQLTLSKKGFAPVYSHGSLWLIVGTEIQQIDPTTMEPAGNPVPAGGNPASLAVGNGALWTVDYFNGKLTRLASDHGPTWSMRVAKKPNFPAGDNLSAVAVGGGATWVAVTAGY